MPNVIKQFKKFISIIVFLLIVVLLMTQRHSLANSFDHISGANTRDICFAGLLTLYTFVASALSYKILSPKPIAFNQILIAQIGANFINRLLPAGVGGIGANIQFLRHKKLSAFQATATVAVNNGLGIIGNFIIVSVVLAAGQKALTSVAISSKILVTVLTITALLFTIIAANQRVRTLFNKALITFGHNLAAYRRHKYALLAALLVQMTLTAATVGAFWLSLHAVGLHVSFGQALVVFTAGFALGSAVPTPAGIGGVEAGLLSGLLAYNVPSIIGLAGVVLFRIISYWIPLVLSAPVFWYASRRHYFISGNSRRGRNRNLKQS